MRSELDLVETREFTEKALCKQTSQGILNHIS